MSTSTLMRGATALAASVLIALGTFAATSGIATPRAFAASADGPCAGTNGVTVVVDATNAGGDISVRCALGAQASGWEALQHAGHSIESVPQYPGTAVCKIDGRPAAGYPTCWQTNFWSYFHAPNTATGAAWKFAGTGAATYKPAPGSVEGWKYTSVTTQNDPPARGPVFATSTPTTQSPPPPPPAGSSPPPTIRVSAPAANAAPTGSAPPNASGTPAPAGAPGSAAPSATVSTDTSSTTTSAPGTARSEAPGRELDPVDVSNQTSSGNGAPIGTIVGVALVICVAGAAGVVAYRRRASHATDN